MNDYEINDETLAIMPNDIWNSIILEDHNNFKINKKPIEILDYSCKYFGSSYPGRKEGSREILNSGYKLPILVEDSKNLVFLPTISPISDDCSWISLNKIKKYYSIGDGLTKIEFKNNSSIVVNVSFNSFNNQVMRASRLESIIRNRKEKIGK